MKRAVSIIVVCCLLAQCLVQLGIVAWYKANKEYITQAFCENKAKPELNCCGKCYLNKQLKKVSDEEPASKNKQTKQEQTELLACSSLPDYSIKQPQHFAVPAIFNPAMQHLHGRGFSPNIFHPPALLG